MAFPRPLADSPVDVAIPVHDAPVLTRRCIESVLDRLGGSVRRLYVQDDASGPETRAMLDSFADARVHVHHAGKNLGFGASVNEAVARSDAPLLLVLNSDTEADGDFLPLLRAALSADPRLAAVNPGGNAFAGVDFDRYRRQTGGHVRAHRLAGYAFLIRRQAFEEVGGFDPAFGRGYFEDDDLSRRLVRRGWGFGVHPEARLHHENRGSFGRSRRVKELIRRNRADYYRRYPEARRHVLLLSGRRPFETFPPALGESLERVIRGGGHVHWLTPDPAARLPCLEVSSGPMTLAAAARMMLRRSRTRHKRKSVSEVWALPGAARRVVAIVVPWAHRRGLAVRVWDESETEVRGT